VRLVLFLVIFSLLYSILHAYAFLRANQALSFGMAAVCLLWPSCLIMIFCPAIVRLAESLHLKRQPRFLHISVTYGWASCSFCMRFSGDGWIPFGRLLIQLILQKNLYENYSISKMVFFIALLCLAVLPHTGFMMLSTFGLSM